MYIHIQIIFPHILKTYDISVLTSPHILLFLLSLGALETATLVGDNAFDLLLQRLYSPHGLSSKNGVISSIQNED